MGRAIAGVVVGYVAMFLFFSAAYLGMGQDNAFRPGSYEPSVLWLVVSFVLGLLTAVLGEFVCARISRSDKAPLVLAGLVLVLSLLFAIPTLLSESRTRRRP